MDGRHTQYLTPPDDRGSVLDRRHQRGGQLKGGSWGIPGTIPIPTQPTVTAIAWLGSEGAVLQRRDLRFSLTWAHRDEVQLKVA